MHKNIIALITLTIVILTLIFIRNKVLQTNQQTFPNNAYAQTSCDSLPSWPQVAHDAQRTGKSPENLGTNYDRPATTKAPTPTPNGRIESQDITWKYAFQPDKIFPQVQAIVYCNKVFVGTEGANGQTAKIYAFNAQDGTEDWTYAVGAPILASVAAGKDAQGNHRVYFGAMDGAVYALNVDDGSLAWKKQVIVDRGFSTSPVLADNKIMLGGRNGVVYVLDQVSGAMTSGKGWQKHIGAPILQTAAYNQASDGKKRVFFGAMDMYLYALDVANNGIVLWKSKVKGMAMKDYWPVVHAGQHKVLIHPIRDTRVGVKESDLPACDANPNDPNCKITLRIFDELTGAEQPTIPHDNVPLMNDAMTPPCVWDSESVVLSAKDKPDAQGGIGSWSQVSLVTRSIVRQFIDSSGENGYNNSDEDMAVSCAENSVLAIHMGGSACGGAGYSGVFHITGPTTGNWTCYNVGRASSQMQNNTQGAGTDPASIANGIFYHIAHHGIIAVNTN